MKQIFVVFSCVLFISAFALASGHQAGAWVADKRDDGMLAETVRRVCAEPSYTFIDFSNFRLTDEELGAVFEGLVERQTKLEDKQTLACIKLISPAVTEEGFRTFLRKLQEGFVSSEGTVRPDLRRVIMQTGLPLTEDVFEELSRAAPRLLGEGNLILIEGN